MDLFDSKPINVSGNRHFSALIIGPRPEKICRLCFANNKDADQPAHPHSLISAFAFRSLKSITSKLATSEISTSKLVSVAELAGLNLTLSETPKTGFLAMVPKLCRIILKSIANCINTTMGSLEYKATQQQCTKIVELL